MSDPAKAAPQHQTALVKRQEQVKTVRNLLEKSKDQIALALPKHLTPERLMRIAMTTIQKNPKLLEADPRSLIGAIIQCAQLGLEPDSVLGHAYLVPFWNSQLGRFDVTFIPGYKGLIALAKRGGEASHIHAVNVYEGEYFRYEEGLAQTVEHKPLPPSKRTGGKIGTYAVVKFTGSQDSLAAWMWAEETELIRDRALLTRRIDPRKDPREKWGPWGTDEDEMFKKTAIRRLSKVLSLSPEFQKAAALDELAEAGLPQNLDQEVFLGPEGIVSAEMEAIAGKTAEKAEDLKAKIAAKNAEKAVATDPGEPAAAEPQTQDASSVKKGAGEAQDDAGATKQGGGAVVPHGRRRSSPQGAPAVVEQGKKMEDTETPAGPEEGSPFPDPSSPPATPAEGGGGKAPSTAQEFRSEVIALVALLAQTRGWAEIVAFKTLLAAAGLFGKYTHEELHKIDNKKDLEALYKIGLQAVAGEAQTKGAGTGTGLPFKTP